MRACHCLTQVVQCGRAASHFSLRFRQDKQAWFLRKAERPVEADALGMYLQCVDVRQGYGGQGEGGLDGVAGREKLF